MDSFRQYLLVLRHPAGLHTARTIDGHPAAATGMTAAAAVEQVRAYLTWLHQREPWTLAPNFFEPRLVELTVTLRLASAAGGRRLLLQPLSLKLPTVQGVRRNGEPVWAAPLLNACFACAHDAEGEAVLRDYLQSELTGRTAEAIRPYLTETPAEIHDVRVRTPHRWRETAPQLTALRGVAEPLGDRTSRRGLSRAWRRERLLEELVQWLTRERAPLLLVGPRGAGKTTVLADAVRRVERADPDAEANQDGESAASLDDLSHKPAFRRRFWLTSGPRLIAGMQYLGQWEERLEEVIEELADIQGALCCENLLDLATVGGTAPESSIGAFCTPFLEQGELRLIAEATVEELDACRRILPRLADCFRVLQVPPLAEEDARAVLRIAFESRGQQASLSVDPEAAVGVHRLFKRFLPYDALPGRAVSFIQQLFDAAEQDGRRRVDGEWVLQRFIDETGLPELFLRDQQTLSLEEARLLFRDAVIGQPDAREAAAELLTRIKSGLNDPSRPLGVLLFCGPTGVGKTELAKQLARQLFGSGRDPRQRLIRLDMSEYSGPGAAERLMVGPDGQPSDLIRRIRQQPFALLLLDEIEKAAPEVFDALLGMFDEGRLTDRLGRTAAFRSAVIVMTSNLGVRRQAPIGYESAEAALYERDIRTHFRPEFFNRIDRIVTFQPLDHEHMREITRKELREVERRPGMVERGARLRWDEAVVDLLVTRGFDARYGARPLQRTLERLVVAPLARWLVDHPGESRPLLRLRADEGGCRVMREADPP